MGLMVVKDTFVMRGIGTVLMVTVKEGTLRQNVSLNLPNEYSANVKMIEKESQSISEANPGEEVSVVVTAPESAFSKGQEIEFEEAGVTSEFRG